MTVKSNNQQTVRKRLARLKDYDYKQAGYYFLTICTHHKEPLLGEVKDGKVISNVYSSIVQNTWNELPKHYENVELDEFIIMPDHIHAIIQLKDPVLETGLSSLDEICNSAPSVEIGLIGVPLQVSSDRSKPISTTLQDYQSVQENPSKQDSYATSSVEIGLTEEPFQVSDDRYKPISTTNNRIKQYSLAEVVRGFKTFSAIRINRVRETKGLSVWQKNYFERIVRNEKELNNIRQYISSNPQRYQLKCSLEGAH